MKQKPKLYYSSDSLLFTHVVCLRSTNNEKSVSGIISMNLEHCSPDTLNYINIKYSDSELERLIEESKLLQKIDSKLRNELLK